MGPGGWPPEALNSRYALSSLLASVPECSDRPPVFLAERRSRFTAEVWRLRPSVEINLGKMGPNKVRWVCQVSPSQAGELE